MNIRLPAHARAPALSRMWLQRFGDRLGEERLQTLQLLVTELITNSLRHGSLADQDSILLRVAVQDRCIRVEVMDPGSGFDPLSQPAHGEESGWGMWLVARLSDRWGYNHNGEMSIWFEIDI